MDEILKGMNIKDGAQMKQAENIWKMLDNMQQSSPEDYRKFIDKNVKEGMQDLEKNKEKEEKKREVKVKSRICYKVQAELKTISIEAEQQQQYQALFVMKDQPVPKEVVISQKAKFYLNILTSIQMVGPLDKQLNPVDLSINKDLKKWDKIPLQICNRNESKTSSFNLPVYFYDLVVSEKVFDIVKKDKADYNMFFDYMLRNFQERLKMD